MKQLACEMCGSTDLIKQDGVFVCQTCGCKYSLDEARKMMVEGTVEVTGTVKVDNSSSIGNYLEMAKNAFANEKNAEAETYCNRILEMDLFNWEAWKIKGNAVGYQSTIYKPRIKEAVTCFAKGFEYCPEDKRNEYTKDCVSNIEDMNTQYVKMKLENLLDHLTDDTIKDFAKFASIIDDIMSFSKEIEEQLPNNTNISQDSIKEFLDFSIFSGGGLIYAGMMSNRLMAACKILKDRFTNNNYPIVEFIQKMTAIATMEASIPNIWVELSSKVSYAKEYKYDDILINTIITNSYEQGIQITQDAYNLAHKKASVVPDILSNLRNGWKNKLTEVKTQIEERTKQRTEEYWNTHKEEKEKLVSERNNLDIEIHQIREQIGALENNKQNVSARPYLDDIKNRIMAARDYKQKLPILAEKHNLEKQLTSLQNKLGSLSFFKRKEKTEISSQIDNIKRRLSELQKNIDYQMSEIDKQIASLESERNRLQEIVSQQQAEIDHHIEPYQERLNSITSRLKEIENELNRPR